MSDSKFGDAPLKIEGQPFWVDELEAFKNKPEHTKPYETTWVERPMPVELEEMAHAVLKAMFKQWLIDKGYEEDDDE